MMERIISPAALIPTATIISPCAVAALPIAKRSCALGLKPRCGPLSQAAPVAGVRFRFCPISSPRTMIMPLAGYSSAISARSIIDPAPHNKKIEAIMCAIADQVLSVDSEPFKLCSTIDGPCGPVAPSTIMQRGVCPLHYSRFCK